MSQIEIVAIAKVCHEANRAFCAVNGDESQMYWNVAPAWQRQSAIEGVQFHMDNPDARYEDAHEKWMKRKLLEGWIWGPEKDEGSKQHPCIMPFEMLPDHQQAKDRLFRSIVHALVGGPL